MSNLSFDNERQYIQEIEASTKHLIREQKRTAIKYLAETTYENIDKDELINSTAFANDAQSEADTLTTYRKVTYQILLYSNNHDAIDSVETLDENGGINAAVASAAYYAVLADIDAEFARLTVDEILEILGLTKDDCMKECSLDEDTSESLDEFDTTLDE